MAQQGRGGGCDCETGLAAGAATACGPRPPVSHRSPASPRRAPRLAPAPPAEQHPHAPAPGVLPPVPAARPGASGEAGAGGRLAARRALHAAAAEGLGRARQLLGTPLSGPRSAARTRAHARCAAPNERAPTTVLPPAGTAGTAGVQRSGLQPPGRGGLAPHGGSLRWVGGRSRGRGCRAAWWRLACRQRSAVRVPPPTSAEGRPGSGSLPLQPSLAPPASTHALRPLAPRARPRLQAS